MIRSALALAALLGLAISSGVAYSCEYMQTAQTKQTVVAVDTQQQSKPVATPTTKKDG